MLGAIREKDRERRGEIHTQRKRERDTHTQRKREREK